MPLLYIVGDAIVTRDELRDAIQLRKLGKEFAFPCGSAHKISKLDLPDEAPVPFTAIGPGKPLTVRISRIYPGKHPHHEGKNMVLTSSMKGIEIYESEPKAVNLIRQNVAPRKDFPGPTATEHGTRLVFYCAAIPDDVTYSNLKFEMAFNSITRDIIELIETVLPKAASIPAFAPYEAYLLGLNQALHLATSVAQSLFPIEPAFKGSYDFYFHEPGYPEEGAGFRIACNDELWKIIRSEKYTYEGTLKDKNGAPYLGDEPYVIFSVDGAANPSFNKFAPTAASADLLRRYFGIGENESSTSDMVVNALQLVTDVKYRERALAKQKEIEQGDPKNLPRLKEELNNLIKAIQTPSLKP